MDAKVGQLCDTLLEELAALPSDQRILVGICGIPGSGKSSLARRIVAALNEGHSRSGFTTGKSEGHPTTTAPADGGGGQDVAILVGMDGWHYPRSTLRTFADPQKAFDRRGAEYTFDSVRFASFVRDLRRRRDETLCAPSFDHALKDPIEDDIAVMPHHRVVIVEGLYCNCAVGAWRDAASEFDHRWVSLIDRQEARRRLVARHVATGVAEDEAEARWRADNNDLPNGDWLMSHLLEPYTVVESIEEPTWAS